MAMMFFLRFTVYENIIQVGGAVDVEYVSQDLVDVRLESPRGVAEAKGHD